MKNHCISPYSLSGKEDVKSKNIQNDDKKFFFNIKSLNTPYLEVAMSVCSVGSRWLYIDLFYSEASYRFWERL